MTLSELAAKLRDIDVAYDIGQHSAEAKAAGLVIVWGESDDCLEFRGAIDGRANRVRRHRGRVVRTRDIQGVPSRGLSARAACRPHEMPRMHAIWNDDPRLPAWTLNIPWPHETFDILDDGVPFSRGAVFRLADIPAEVE